MSSESSAATPPCPRPTGIACEVEPCWCRAETAAPTARPQRITIDGGAIESTTQTTKCGYCRMGLCHSREWHPHLACEVFLEKHDSREVWRALWREVKADKSQVAGADRLHEIFYG